MTESLGRQSPRVECFPDFDRSLGPEFIEIAELAGLYLDPWQKHVLENSMGIRADGRLATPQVGVCVPRQNGKGAILEAMELGRLFILGSSMTIHSAHLYNTSMEAFRRVSMLVQNTPELDRQVRRYINTNGKEGIELRDGSRLQFAARTKGGGRGFTGDCVVLDEAMYLPQSVMSALGPTGSAKENRQLWYLGSAVDQMSMPDGVPFARLRQEGIHGTNASLAYFEWSVDLSNPDELTEEMVYDEELRSVSNPARGIRISDESITLDRGILGLRGFATERFNIGDWPAVDGEDAQITLEDWLRLVDQDSQIAGKVCFVADVNRDRTKASIAVAGIRSDGLKHVEIVPPNADRPSENPTGTAWLAKRLRQLQDQHSPAAILVDGGPAMKALLPEFEREGVIVTTVDGNENAQACAILVDAVNQRTLRHLGTPELSAAIKGAGTRDLGEAWAWARKNSTVDITPLVASTIAHWAIAKYVEGEIVVMWA